jgi:hypothetical protein
MGPCRVAGISAFACGDCPLDCSGQGYTPDVETSLVSTPARSQVRAGNTRITSELRQGYHFLEPEVRKRIYK